MATQVFLGNPSSNIVAWIKRKKDDPVIQDHNATIINNTSIWQDPNNYGPVPIPAEIKLSNDLTSYDIQPQNDVQVPVKAGTYYARINCPTWDDDFEYENDTCAVPICINNIYADELGFSFNSNNHYVNENYVIEENKTYEFTYGHKNL